MDYFSNQFNRYRRVFSSMLKWLDVIYLFICWFVANSYIMDNWQISPKIFLMLQFLNEFRDFHR